MIKDYYGKGGLQLKLNSPQLMFHTMTDCQKLIIFYGGMLNKTTISGDLFILEESKSKMITALYTKHKDKFPIPRFCHSANYNKQKNVLYIFGGYSTITNSCLNDLYELDLNAFTNLKIEVTCNFKEIKITLISPRCKHCSFYSDKTKKLYIYGGYGFDYLTMDNHILNDFYSFDTQSGQVETILFKGGEEMKGKLFHSVELSNNNEQNTIAFFSGEDLSCFFLYNITLQFFQKILISYDIPGKRDYFTVNALSDDRIILLGGCYNNYCYLDCYILNDFPNTAYSNNKENILITSYQWNRFDLNGRAKNGYSGHQCLVLHNDCLFISGGSDNAFDGLNPNSIKQRPMINENFQILDLNGNLFWVNSNKTSKMNNETIKDLNEHALIINETDEGSIIKMSNSQENPISTIEHIMEYLPSKANDGKGFIVIHGGRNKQNKIVPQCFKYIFTDKTNGTWSECKSDKRIASHASCVFSGIYLDSSLPDLVIISGGITIVEIEAEKPKIIPQESAREEEIDKEIITKREEKETENGELYYLNASNQWKVIQYLKEGQQNQKNEPMDRIGIDIASNNPLKRYGHSMVQLFLLNEKKEKIPYVFIYGGYQQFEGFTSQLIMLELKYISAQKHKEKGLYYSLKSIDLNAYGLRGRIHFCMTVAFNNLFIYGGANDKEVFDDMYMISIPNAQLNNPSIQKIIYNQGIINQGLKAISLLPRFGSSVVFYPDSDKKDDKGKMIVFGGRTSNDINVPAREAITDQLIIFSFQRNQDFFEVNAYIPTLYGFTEKRTRHKACFHLNRMYVWGVKDEFLIMEMPLESLVIEDTLFDFVNNNRILRYDDWEQGLEKRQNKQWKVAKTTNDKESSEKKVTKGKKGKKAKKPIVASDDEEKETMIKK